LRRIRHIQDVVDWGLCVGCGACASVCEKSGVSLVHIDTEGIRPVFDHQRCAGCTDCLFVCPGYGIDSEAFRKGWGALAEENLLIGPSLEIWEGHAASPDIRYRGSSGGAVTALALYCLEREGMRFVLHTGMDPERPWRNVTVKSRSGAELILRAGSRYCPSSPCEALRDIEESDGPCVFIGKPCDAAAAIAVSSQRPRLRRNLGLVLTFFCAGPPCTKGTLSQLDRLGIRKEQVREIRYRGHGWPGEFTVVYDGGERRNSLSYKEAWGSLAKHHRSFRCHLCPDGLGEIADVSCGDAWHRYAADGNPGRSLVVARTARGRDILRKAMTEGYLDLVPSNPENVAAAQGLVKRRQQVFGRLLAMRLLLVPTPDYRGFPLFRAWRETSIVSRAKTVLGTLKRLVLRGLWRRNPVPGV